MFNNLRRYYNQNRKKIWKVIIIIAFAFAMLQVANTIAKNNNERQIREATAQVKTPTTESSSKSNTVSGGASTSNSSITQNITNKKVTVIEQFVDYCNKQDIESAYNMLTDDCKNEIYNNIETFKTYYCDSTFENKQKQATIEKWADNTYMVKLAEDPLKTGKIVSTKEEQKVDYITVIQDDDNYKLNISKYVGYKKIAKTKKIDGVTIEVIGRNTYIDYETYSIKVSNNSEEKITLDRLENPNSIYIEDSKGVHYPAYNSELANSMMNISSGHTKQMSIKFFSTYVDTKRIKQIVFADFRINNEQNQVVIAF